jgi:hypothetical protein
MVLGLDREMDIWTFQQISMGKTRLLLMGMAERTADNRMYLQQVEDHTTMCHQGQEIGSEAAIRTVKAEVMIMGLGEDIMAKIEVTERLSHRMTHMHLRKCMLITLALLKLQQLLDTVDLNQEENTLMTQVVLWIQDASTQIVRDTQPITFNLVGFHGELLETALQR